MICPNCQMQQPQGNFAYCVRCNYPLQTQNQIQGCQTGYQQPYPAQQQQVYPQTYYTPPPVQQANHNIKIMYDANGNQVYVQIMYSATGQAFYVQMIPQIIGQDAYGNPVYHWTQAPTPPVPVQQQMPVQQQPVQENFIKSVKQPERKKSFLDTVSETSSKENAEFLANQNEAIPPVPVLSHSNSNGLQSESNMSIPDRPAISATAIASGMYTAKQSPPQGTSAFVSKVSQQVASTDYDIPVSMEELLKEEADTAFVQEIPDEETLLQCIFADKPQNYYVSCTSLKAVSIMISSDEITSVSERNLYQSSKKMSKSQVTSEPEQKKPEKLQKSETIKPEKSKPEPEPAKKLFGSKKQKEQKKAKPIIVDADAIFGDSKMHRTEMLGIRVDGSEDDVQRKLTEMRYGGKKSVRSMKSADQEIDMQAMVNDPQKSEIVRRVLEGQEVKKAYASIEENEVAKALAQLNQGIFPKKF
ncbi:MAG: hypothetical protein K2H93_09180 [Oscillospiraceae bacterium]|nr:hypothetical protein [Oscillospiraceae bacterium]